jgi:hypothetical protein
MKKIYLFCSTIALLFFLSSCYEESRLLVKAEFQTTIKEDNYTAPVNIKLENKSTGADFYQWTFEGGTPASSKEKDPGDIRYDKAGNYKMILEAWNDKEKDRKEFAFSVDSAVTASFDLEILTNDFAPAGVKITNKTKGASAFQWTFEGGEPASSTERNPPSVNFSTEGEHKILLTASNGRKTFSVLKTITLKSPMYVDFDIKPSTTDFDYEIPFTAKLINKTISGLNYEWFSNGGSIANRNSKDTEITFGDTGTYTITLKGDNGKDIKTVSKELRLKKNTNLYTLKDVKFGVKRAEATIGCFYSLSQWNIIPRDEVTAGNGPDINLAFFGLDASFSRCYFTSPDMVKGSGFNSIPGAVKTYFINKLEDTSISFTNADFNSMTDDSKLRSLDIKGASNTSSWFTNVFIPRIVLFETQNGLKGVIRIKAFVSEEENSYILTDIKVQKERVL